jgi:chorismate lyase/3-hydroxybenzoate synthase
MNPQRETTELDRPTLDVEYCRGDQRRGVLARVNFGGAQSSPSSGAPLLVEVDMAPLEGSPSTEVWHSRGLVRTGTENDIRYASDDHHLMGVIEVEEGSNCDIEQAAFYAYTRIREFQAICGFPSILRMWNYIDDINFGEENAERYKRFSKGRARGFGPTAREDYPAASAVGKQRRTNLVQVAWIAGRSLGSPIENPRQVSAYNYPPQYGPSSPSFARAMITTGDGILISGTASIVGHKTLHIGDVAGQLDETMRNLQAVVNQATHFSDGSNRGWLLKEGLLRVYVRNAEDAYFIKESLLRSWPTDRIMILSADICRADLLLEIECVLQN